MRNNAAILAILVMVALGALAGYLAARSWAEDPMRAVEAEAAAAWAAAWLPYKTVLTAGLGAVGLVLLTLSGWAAFLWLRRRALTIYPDQHGVMPAIILEPGHEQVLIDTNALAGPLIVTAAGPEYRLPAGSIPQLQAGANQGAAMTRAMRAWATHEGATRSHHAPPVPWSEQQPPTALPPIEVITGDESHIYRLLEESER